jgi:hypothetical protein
MILVSNGRLSKPFPEASDFDAQKPRLCAVMEYLPIFAKMVNEDAKWNAKLHSILRRTSGQIVSKSMMVYEDEPWA